MALNVETFADLLEERYGAGIYRKIKVIPAKGTTKKRPVGEKSNMAPGGHHQEPYRGG